MLKMKMKKSTAGMALMEVMIALGILTIITLGITTTISQSMKSQKDSALLGALTSSKTNLTRVILDGAAWSNTVTNNSSLSCLSGTAGCPATTTPNSYPQLITVLYDAANNKYYDGSTATSGVTPMGVTGSTTTSCTNFVTPTSSAPTGNDSCPISYVIGARFDCPTGAAQCLQPVVTVQAQLVYNPSKNGHSITAINATTYSPLVVRGAGNYVRNDSVFIAQQESTTANGGGICNPGVPIQRDYTTGIASTVLPTVDTASTTQKFVTAGNQGNMLDVNATSGVKLKAGGYICDISAVGWAVNGWTLQLTYNNATPVTTPAASNNVIAQETSFAKKDGSYIQSEIVLPKVHIDLQADTYLTVWQTCSTNATTKSTIPPNYEQAIPGAGTPPASMNVGNFAMGIPIASNNAGTSYGLSVYSSISCTRVY